MAESKPFQFEPSLLLNNITPGEYEDFFKKILEIVRCCNYDKCKQILRRPLVQCLNGHGICPDCQSLKNRCPLQSCRKKFRDTNFPLLEVALEDLPKKCRFEGCEVLMMPKLDDLHDHFCAEFGEENCVHCELKKPRYDHERWCSFGVVDCKLCEWKGTRKSILTHIIKDHKDTKIYKDKNEHLMWSDLHPNKLEGSSSFVPILSSRNLFWMCITDYPLEKLIIVKFIFVPTIHEGNDMQGHLVIKNLSQRIVSMTFMTVDSLLEQDDESCSFALHFVSVENFIKGPHDIDLFVVQQKEIF